MGQNLPFEHWSPHEMVRDGPTAAFYPRPVSDDGILEPLDGMRDSARSTRSPAQRSARRGEGGDGILESLDEFVEPPAAAPRPLVGEARPGDEGILETLDDIGTGTRRGLARRELFVEPGVRLEHTPSGTIGTVKFFTEGVEIVLRDQLGGEKSFDPVPGLFRHEGDLVALRAPLGARTPSESSVTASGSIAASDTSARVARASRIYVEGIHDAELIERVWGDDLRYEGIVVEQLEGADDLAGCIRDFGTGHGRRLGVLLDHLVEGTKESRIAAAIDDRHVLILGHPYVDIWQAIKPASVGIDAWPVIPKGQPWKQGILAALGVSDHPAQFWKRLLGQVNSWKDIETPLVNSVEQLIDFVTTPTPAPDGTSSPTA